GSASRGRWQRSLPLAGIGAAAVLVAWVGVHRWVAAPPTIPSVSSGGVAHDVAPHARRVSIAVLPFVTLGAAAGDEYFADGLTEDIIDALGRFPEMSVLSPKSVGAYKGKAARPEDISRELKVRYVAEGSVRRSPERLRVAVRLTDAAAGTLLWADQY